VVVLAPVALKVASFTRNAQENQRPARHECTTAPVALPYGVCGSMVCDTDMPTGAWYGPGPPPCVPVAHQYLHADRVMMCHAPPPPRTLPTPPTYPAWGVKREAHGPPMPSLNVWKKPCAAVPRNGVAGLNV
jgi:hypothetical protein